MQNPGQIRSLVTIVPRIPSPSFWSQDSHWSDSSGITRRVKETDSPDNGCLQLAP